MMMMNRCSMFVIVAVVAKTSPAAANEPSPSPDLDAKAIQQAAGTPATVTDDGVVRISWSRDDVAVTIDGMPFRPQAGLGSWAAFTALPNGDATVMGDTVVFEDEITPARETGRIDCWQVVLHRGRDHIGGGGNDNPRVNKRCARWIR